MSLLTPDNKPTPELWLSTDKNGAITGVLASDNPSPPTSLPVSSAALWGALKGFSPKKGHDYVTENYELAFNWNDLTLDKDLEGTWHAVVFRSQRKEFANEEAKLKEISNKLYELDEGARNEGFATGKLLLYWYGVPNDNRENMATCIWESKGDAQGVVNRGRHQEAVKITGDAYDSARIQEYEISKRKGEMGLHITLKNNRDIVAKTSSRSV